MQQEEKMAAMNIMSILLPYAYQAASEHAVLLGSRLSRLCIYNGLHKAGAIGFLTYGRALSRADREVGYRIGKLALSVAQNTLAKEQLPRLEVHFYAFLHHWKCPLKESLAPLANAAQTGLEAGDIEFAMFARRFECVHSLFCGKPLSDVEEMTVGATNHMSRFMHKLTSAIVQFVRNLRGQASDAQ
jgi:predicted ATPase